MLALDVYSECDFGLILKVTTLRSFRVKRYSAFSLLVLAWKAAGIPPGDFKRTFDESKEAGDGCSLGFLLMQIDVRHGGLGRKDCRGMTILGGCRGIF